MLLMLFLSLTVINVEGSGHTVLSVEDSEHKVLALEGSGHTVLSVEGSGHTVMSVGETRQPGTLTFSTVGVEER